MGYSILEQETVFTFDNEIKKWHVYSTVPKHIRKLSTITETITVLEYEDDRPIAIKAVLEEKQLSMRLLRTMTEEQRKESADRLSKARKARTLHAGESTSDSDDIDEDDEQDDVNII